MALNAQILLSILAHEADAGDISQTLRATPATYALALTDGTGANQAQVVWSDAQELNASGTTNIELPSATDDRGTVVFSAIKAVYIRNTGTTTISWRGLALPEKWTTGPLQVAEGDGVHIPAAGVLLLTNPSDSGWTVAAGDDQIEIVNESGSAPASFEIVLIGEGTIT
jgi:hypothetical protein